MEAMTLLELLVVISLCAFIVLALSGLFISSQQQVALTRGQLTIQYHGQLVSHLLRDNIHHAGFIHCFGKHRHTFISPISNILGVKGFSKTSQKIPSSIKGHMANHTQGLEIQSVQPIAKLDSTDSLKHIPNTIKLKSGDELLLTDCQRLEAVRVDKAYQNKEVQSITLNKKLKNFPQGFWMDKYVDTFYYIAKPSYTRYSKYPLYSLYTKQGDQRAQELVSGVNALRVNFVTDSDKLLMGAEAHDRGHVSLVQLELLLDSVDTVGLISRPYHFADKLFSPAIPKLYQAWSVWAALP